MHLQGPIGHSDATSFDARYYIAPAVAPGSLSNCGGGSDSMTRLATLTTQQLRVLALMAEGKANKVIARHLSISPETVKKHVSAVLDGLKVHNRTQATLLVYLLDGPTTILKLLDRNRYQR